MTIARSAADVLSDHVELALECLDRIYLNGYVPLLQGGGDAAYFFRNIRGKPVSALMAPMTRAFMANIERYARDHGIDLVRFEKGKRKDDMTQDYLRRGHGGEGVLYIGKAQERARVVRTEKRRDPEFPRHGL